MAAGLQTTEYLITLSSGNLFTILLIVLAETATMLDTSEFPICRFKTRHPYIFRAVGVK
jgi:hypothetical protein